MWPSSEITLVRSRSRVELKRALLLLLLLSTTSTLQRRSCPATDRWLVESFTTIIRPDKITADNLHAPPGGFPDCCPFSVVSLTLSSVSMRSHRENRSPGSAACAIARRPIHAHTAADAVDDSDVEAAAGKPEDELG